nr:MAG TPA: hypothetical protein [Caudoviricetes sp.]
MILLFMDYSLFMGLMMDGLLVAYSIAKNPRRLGRDFFILNLALLVLFHTYLLIVTFVVGVFPVFHGSAIALLFLHRSVEVIISANGKTG